MAVTTDDVSLDGPEPTAWQVLAPMIDLITPMAVRAAATLRVADLMTDGPAPVDELARGTSTDSDALARLLRHLVAHGLFAEPSPGEFGLNHVAALLHSEHPSGMRVQLDLHGFGGQMDLAFTGLLHTMRNGQPAWESVFGAPFWHYLATNPAMHASYDATMASGPEYVERGRVHIAARGLDGRCGFSGQSFFDSLPPGGDVYVLSHVIHDWGDKEATMILRRCAEAAGGSGRVVVIEGPGGAGTDPAGFAEMNLRMLVFCGGRERSVDDYTALAGQAGLSVIDVRMTPLGQISIEYAPTASG